MAFDRAIDHHVYFFGSLSIAYRISISLLAINFSFGYGFGYVGDELPYL